MGQAHTNQFFIIGKISPKRNGGKSLAKSIKRFFLNK
jgi:hypothetical protein